MGNKNSDKCNSSNKETAGDKDSNDCTRRDFLKSAGAGMAVTVAGLAGFPGLTASADSRPDRNNDFAVWIDDLLGAVKEDPGPKTIKLIESCGKGCASRRNATEGMAGLREVAAHCKTRTEIVDFLNERLPVTFTEAKDGIIMHLGKDKCTCRMAPDISKNADMLCHCTRGHEKATWSVFFDRQVEVEIVESILRGGNDCVLKIIV